MTHNPKNIPGLHAGEQILLKAQGSHKHNIRSGWKVARCLLTNRRLMMRQRASIRLDISLDDIKGLAVEKLHYVLRQKECLTISYNSAGGAKTERIWFIADNLETWRTEITAHSTFFTIDLKTIETISAQLDSDSRDILWYLWERRVTDLARVIARETGLPKVQVDTIRMAGIIHDIGKISVPAEILNKPGQLKETEFSLIKDHPRSGYDILKEIEWPCPIAKIVLQHHERVDGSGYPQGLSGKDILLEAKLLGVADVVESMSSHRPYRPALGLDRALEEISKNRGILYDTGVVDACLRVFREKGFEWD